MEIEIVIFYHKIFKINYKMAPAIILHPSQDESVYAGHAPKESFSYHVLAPSERVALAHFQEKFNHYVSKSEYSFELDGIDTIELNACLVSMSLT